MKTSNIKQRFSRLARAAIAASLALIGGIAVQATGETPALAACPTESWYDITSSSSYHLPAFDEYYKDGPGGTMTVSVDTASTISATGTVTAGATVSGIVAEAKVEVSASITGSKSITVGHTYSRDITPGKFGNMQYGSWGYQMTWKYWRINPNCTSTLISSGSGFKAPTSSVGWRYWETSS